MPLYFNAPNRFPVPCLGCRRIVPVGLAVSMTRDPNGRWAGWHKECIDAKNAASDVDLSKQTRVDIEVEEDDRVGVRFTGPGSRTTFAGILSSHGYFWSGDFGRYFGTIDALPALIEEVKDRYSVHMGQQIQRLMERRLEQALGDQAEAAERAKDIDVILKEKDASLSLYEFQKKSIQWLAPRRKALLGHPPGLGKAQPLDAKVLTPHGWKLMGDVEVGDEVIGSNGKATRIVGVFPQGERDIYRVTFKDGASTECDGDHLWRVRKTRKKTQPEWGTRMCGGTSAARVVKTLDLPNLYNNGTPQIPVAPAVEFRESADLPLDPYFLGAILGDGCITQPNRVNFSSIDAEQTERMRSLMPAGAVMHVRGPHHTFTSGRSGRPKDRVNPALDALRSLGLMGHGAGTKFVPEVYKTASVEDRTALLGGLLDTDGSVCERGYISFTSTSERLVEDVTYLVRSLGGIAKSGKKPAREVNHNDYFVMQIRLPEGCNPFRLERKRARISEVHKKYHPSRVFEKIEYVGKKEAQCIAVDAADSLYVTDDFIVTHNTVIACAALASNIPVLIVCPKNAVGVWVNECCRWRPDYAACSTRTRGDFTYQEPLRGINLLEGRGSFKWPKAGEVAIMGYSVLPLTPAEWEEAQAVVSEWEAKGQPESFTWRPPWFDEKEANGAKGVEVTSDEIVAAQKMLAGKERPVTAPPPGVQVIFDECHMVKFRAGQKQSNRAKRFLALAEYVRANSGRTWGLTGTPLLNEPTELWSVLRACGLANEVFGSRKTFDAMFEKKGKGYEAKNEKSLARKLQRGMLRFSKAQALKELPPKTREHVAVDISPEDAARLDALMADIERMGREKFSALAEREQEAATKADAKRRKREEDAKKRRKKAREDDEDYEEGDEEEDLTDSERIRRTQEQAKQAAADGYVEFEDLSRVRAAVARAKIPALFKVVKERTKTGESLVVFSDLKEPVEFLANKFGGESGGWGLITGDTSAKKRTAIAEAFQRGKLVGIAATIQAAGVALTLTKSHRAIFNDENWVPALNRQAQDRCVVRGQLVATIEGLVPIEDVKVGDEVLTHLGNFKKVTDTWTRAHRGLLTKIEYTRFSEGLECTHDHKVLRQRGETRDWVPAHEVLPGDFVLMPRPKQRLERLQSLSYKSERVPAAYTNPWGTQTSIANAVTLPADIEVDDDLLYLLGWYLAEGCVRLKREGGGGLLNLAGHEDEREILEKHSKTLERLGAKSKIYAKKESKGIELVAYSTELARWLHDLFGTGSRKKVIPEEILLMPEEQARVFLRGYLDGDGYRRNNQQEWVSVSPQIAHQVAMMAAACGEATTVRKTTNGSCVTTWVGCYTENSEADSPHLRKFDDEYVYNPVRSVHTYYANKHDTAKSGPKTYVHDLTVEDDHSFVVGLAAVHNCHRIGQFEPVTIEVLVAKHPIDKMIAEANERKVKLEEATVDAAALDIDAQVVTVADEFAAASKTVDDIQDAHASDLDEAFEATLAEQYESLLPRPPAPPPPPPRPAGAVLPPISTIASSAGPRPPSHSGVRVGDVYEPATRSEAVVLPPVRRPDRIAPTTPEQVKAAGVIMALMERGGFRPDDTFLPGMAHTLATQGGLSEKQWPWAIKNAQAYSRGAPAGSGPSGKRQAHDDVETWAAGAMVTLAGSDQDRARERNDVGFSKFDNEIGHSLAQQLQSGRGLSEAQWATAVRLAHRYHRQVGEAPTGAPKAQQNPPEKVDDDACWHVVVTEGEKGKRDEGVMGPDDVVVRTRGDVPERLLMPKETYTPEDAAGWADAHGIPVKRVEG